MYKFKEPENFERFNQFVEENHGPILQTSMWANIKKTWKPYFFEGINEKNELVLTVLVLQRKVPFAGVIWYVPSGFIADYTDKVLIAEFTNFIKIKMKEHKVTAFIIDPPIAENISGKNQEQAVEIVRILKSNGYIHNKNRGDFTYQPSLTVAVNLTDENGALTSPKALLKRFEKGVRYSVRIGEQRGLKAYSCTLDDIKKNPRLYKDFLGVMNDTSGRVGFCTRPENYYMDFIEQFEKWILLDLIYYDKKADAKRNEENKTDLQNINSALEKETAPSAVNRLTNEKQSLEAQIKSYEERLSESKDGEGDMICIAGGITIRFGGAALCLFGGTKNLLRNNVRSSHYLNFLRICKSIEEGCSFHDMGRVPHEYMNEHSKQNGLFKFKKSFAADVYEYIGEYILVNRRFNYYLYNNFMPTVKKARVRAIYTIKRILKK